MIEWIECEKELPEKDGSYYVCNFPEFRTDTVFRDYPQIAEYDGYGFKFMGIYREPKYWGKLNPLEKKYGKQVDG